MPDTNGWNKDKALVEFRQQSTDKKIEIIFTDLREMRVDVAMLKVKSGVWGVIGGSITGIFSLIIGLSIWMVKS